jgi:hypothetical protein
MWWLLENWLKLNLNLSKADNTFWLWADSINDTGKHRKEKNEHAQKWSPRTSGG